MKKITALTALVLAMGLLLAACGMFTPGPEKQILGKWMDSTETQGYEFFEDGRVIFTYINVTIPILNIPINDTITGTYTMDTKENTITMNGTIFGRPMTWVYDFEISGIELKLTDRDDNKTVIYIKAENSSST